MTYTLQFDYDSLVDLYVVIHFAAMEVLDAN
jgi:hypothetical protein